MTTDTGRMSREEAAVLLERAADVGIVDRLARDYIALLDEVERLREWVEQQAKAYHALFQRDGDTANLSYSEGQYRMAVKVMHRMDEEPAP